MSDRLRRLFAAWPRPNRAAPDSAMARHEAAQPLLDEDTLRQLVRMRIENGQSFTDWLGGEHEGRRKMHALEFEDYRGYTSGDDFRLIDWNAYARLGDLFVKTSVAEEALSIALIVDCSRSMDWGRPTKLRYAMRLAAALGALALLHGDRVRVVGVGDGIALPGAPLYGPGDLTTLAAELEHLPTLAATDFARGIASFQRAAEPHGAAVVLSDLLAPMADIGALDLLKARGRDVFVIHIIDPSEATLELRGTVELRDSETGATAIRTITPAVRQRYAERFRERTAAIAARLTAGDLHYISASTAVAPMDFIGSGMHGGSLAAPV